MQSVVNTRWRILETKSGTRYVRDKQPQKERSTFVLPGQYLVPFLTGEAEGDYTLAVIMAVRNLLADVKAWNHGRARALDKRGEVLSEPATEEAVSWSVIGAVQFVTHPADNKTRHAIIEAIKKGMPKDDRQSLFKWEEKPTTTHTKILHALNMAIAFRRNELGMPARSTK